jgi:hypothetical protein
MGVGYQAICNRCDEKFPVHEGSGMIAMPFHCNTCGREWWWEFGSGGPLGEPEPPGCECGGTFTASAPSRCPRCRSPEFRRDSEAPQILYD